MSKEKEYSIYGIIGASKYLGKVKAKDKEEAIEKGMELDSHVSLCHHCSSEIDIGDVYEYEANEV